MPETRKSHPAKTAAVGRSIPGIRREGPWHPQTYPPRSSLDVQGHTVGAVGFCAGGGNCWTLALNTAALAAAVPFYGAPVPPVDGLDALGAPVLAIYAELDRTLTRSVLPVITRLEDLQKPFGFHIYEGTNHAFHNDTGANYHRLAACDAWGKTVAFFQKHLP